MVSLSNHRTGLPQTVNLTGGRVEKPRIAFLPTLSSFWVGIGYLLLFGVGTMLSMAAITLLLGIPFALTGDRNRLGRAVSSVAGAGSLAFGVVLMYDITMGTSLLPF